MWDLRYPAPGAVEHDFPISAIYKDTPIEPLGVFAVPGAYTVKLTVDGTTYTRPLTLKMDPRAKITTLGLSRQFALATKIADMMNRSYAALSSPQPPGLRSPQASSGQARQSAEGAAAAAPSRLNDLKALNVDLATAYDVVEGADRAPPGV